MRSHGCKGGFESYREGGRRQGVPLVSLDDCSGDAGNSANADPLVWADFQSPTSMCELSQVGMGIGGEGHTWWDVVTVFPGMYHLGPECPLLVSRPLLLDGSLFGREGSAVTVGVFFVARVGGCRLLWRLCGLG